MTNMFKPSMPDMSAQKESMKRQEELLEKQEARVESEEADERRRLAATMRARRTGGPLAGRSGVGPKGRTRR